MIPTGAGHDAGHPGRARADRDAVRPQPTGISHAPEEHADMADCLIGVDALADVLEELVK